MDTTARQKDALITLKSTETDDYIELEVIAISSTCIKRYYGNLCFSPQILQKNAKNLISKPVLLDHSDSVTDIVGVVLDAWWDEGLQAIKARLQILKAGNERLIALLKMKPSPITDVSIGIEAETELDEQGNKWIKEMRFIELSLVLNGADSNAKILNKKGGCKMERLTLTKASEMEKEDLIQRAIGLQTALEVAEKEIASLKKDAELGRKYYEDLVAEAKRLIRLTQGDNSPVIKLCDGADIDTLKELIANYSSIAKETFKATAKEGDLCKCEDTLTADKLNRLSYIELTRLFKEVN